MKVTVKNEVFEFKGTNHPLCFNIKYCAGCREKIPANHQFCLNCGGLSEEDTKETEPEEEKEKNSMESEEYESILDEAKYITESNRMEDYGHPKHNFADISRLWTAYLTNANGGDAVTVNPKDVSLMMCLFKVAREQSGHKRDNLVDLAGYARTAAMVEGIE